MESGYLPNHFGVVDHALLIADVCEPTRITLVFDHEPVALRRDIECELPVRQNVSAGSQRDASALYSSPFDRGSVIPDQDAEAYGGDDEEGDYQSSHHRIPVSVPLSSATACGE